MECIVSLLAQLWAEPFPRIPRCDGEVLEVSCPHEYSTLQFLIYPSFLSSILSHSLLWGVPRSKAPDPVLPLPTDGARNI